MKTTEILNDFKPDKGTAEKPHYTMAMLITCEGTPYQVRQGDIIRQKETDEWFLVSNIFIPGDRPLVELIPYEPFYVEADMEGSLAGFEHVYISNASHYPIYAIDNDVPLSDFISTKQMNKRR